MQYKMPMLTTHKFLLLNGPPKSGKTTIANSLMNVLPNMLTQRYKMTSPMDQALREFLNMSPQNYIVLREEYKDVDCSEINYKTMRELLIHFSEVFAKPFFGKDIFGKLACNYINQFDAKYLWIIDDCGFKDEVRRIVDRFGSKNVLIIELFRDGTTFDGDSRNYIREDGDFSDVHTAVVHNEYDIPLAVSHIVYLLNKTIVKGLVP